MKKNQLIILLFILISGKIMAQSSMPESITLSFLTDKNLNAEPLKTNTLFFNDSVHVFNYNHGASNWDFTWKENYTYNHFGQRLQVLGMSYNNVLGVFENNFRFTHIYSPQLHPVMDVSHNWETSTSTWNNSTRYIYETDQHGNILKVSSSYWDQIPGLWQNNWQEVNLLDEQGNKLVIYMNMWDNVAGEWVWDAKREISYNYYSNPIGNIYYVYDAISNIWEPVSKIENSYNFMQTIERKEFYFFDYALPGWQLYGKTDYIYDTSGNCWQETYYSYDPVSSMFSFVTREERTFDSNNNLDTLISMNWNAGSFENSHMRVCFYTNVTSIENLVNVEVARLYPVPADDFLYLETSSADFINTKVEIFNVSGQLMASFSGIQPLMKIDVAAYPAGIYMVNVSNAEYIQVLKFVKQ